MGHSHVGGGGGARGPDLGVRYGALGPNLQKGIMAVSEYFDESPLAQRGAAASKLWIWVMGLLRAWLRGGWDRLCLRGKLV